MQWIPKDHSHKKKTNTQSSAAMAIIFWKVEDVLLLEYMQKGTTINAKVCGKAIQN